jgi:hypothetical protein
MTTYNSPFAGDVIQPTDVSYASYNISDDITLVWPINGNTSTDVAARILNINPSTAGLSVYMPPANQVSVGLDALIKNPSAYSLDIVDADGNAIATIGAGEAKYLFITNNSSTAGIWGVIDFGIGISSPDASALAGNGLLAISSTLNQSHPASSFSDGYTFTNLDRALNKVWDSGAGSATLPVSASVGSNWFTIVKNNGTGTLTINASGMDLIDTASNKEFQPNESAFILSTGSGYVTVGYGTSANFFFTALVKPVTSGSYTITASEAQSIIQEYVGTLSGNVTAYYPPVVQLYIISNQVTDNGYTLTVTTGLPGAIDAIIPAGNQSSLICDGINFYNANTVQAGGSVTSLVNGSASNPSIYFGSEPNTGIYRPGSGTLGVSILGTDTFNVTATGIDTIGNVDAIGTGNFEGGISGGDFN